MRYHVLLILLATATAATAQGGPGSIGNPTWDANQASNPNPSIPPPASVQAIPPTTPYPPVTGIPPIYGKGSAKGSDKFNQNDNLGFAYLSLDNAVLASSALANGSYLASSAFSSSSTSVATTAANIGQIIAGLPKCFTKCATDTSNSLSFGSCSGLMNFACACQKPQFVDTAITCSAMSQTKDCAGLSLYPHLLQQGHDIFTNLCKAAGVPQTSQNAQTSSNIIPTYKRPYSSYNYNKAPAQRILHPIIFALCLLAFAVLGMV